MSDTQFISHAQIVPPTLVPRRGLGLFGAVAIVLAILGGALTGGLILLEQTMKKNVEEAKERLAAIHRETEVSSIRQAEILERRLEKAEGLLKSHTYASQVFEFIENHTLDPVQLTAFGYTGGAIKIDAIVPGFVEFAQQVKYYRSITNNQVAEFAFPIPKLNEKGQVVYSAEIKLDNRYIRTQPALATAPSSVVATSTAATASSTQAVSSSGNKEEEI